MRKITQVFAVLALVVGILPSAHAQFGAPVQRPSVEPAGTFIVYPTVGVLHDGDFDFTDVALMMRGRYSVLDQLSVSGQIGGAFGDADQFQFGFGGKYQFLEQSADLPIQVSGYAAFDVGIGDLDTESLAFGPLVGHRFETGNIAITPYTGFGLGFSHQSVDEARGDSSSTDFLFGFILGADLALTRDLSTIMEFDLGATDAIPVLNWHFGVAYALFSAPKYNPPPASSY